MKDNIGRLCGRANPFNSSGNVPAFYLQVLLLPLLSLLFFSRTYDPLSFSLSLFLSFSLFNHLCIYQTGIFIFPEDLGCPQTRWNWVDWTYLHLFFFLFFFIFPLSFLPPHLFSPLLSSLHSSFISPFDTCYTYPPLPHSLRVCSMVETRKLCMSTLPSLFSSLRSSPLLFSSPVLFYLLLSSPLLSCRVFVIWNLSHTSWCRWGTER